MNFIVTPIIMLRNILAGREYKNLVINFVNIVWEYNLVFITFLVPVRNDQKRIL